MDDGLVRSVIAEGPAYSIVSMTTGCLSVLLFAPCLRGAARIGEAHTKDYIDV
ncbi:MAG: hypothetical protein GY946_16810 [bacterium]|nr:hypothetical protein [bacterium]